MVRASVDVLSLAKDETHDVEVSLGSDAGLLRLLITVSDSRLTAHSELSTRHQPRPVDHRTALAKYNVRTIIILLLLLLLLLFGF